MIEYLYSVALTCIAAAVIQTAGKSVSKKYIDIICSLCVICAVVFPVIKAVSDIDANSVPDFLNDISYEYETENSVEIYNSYLHFVSVEDAETLLCEELSKKLGTNLGEIEIDLVTDRSEDKPYITDVVVCIHGGAVNADPEIIKEYVGEKTGVNCRIIYEIDGV